MIILSLLLLIGIALAALSFALHVAQSLLKLAVFLWLAVLTFWSIGHVAFLTPWILILLAILAWRISHSGRRR